MKIATLILLSLTVVLVNCGHRFLGTNVQRPLMYHRRAIFSSRIFQKRIEFVNYTIPRKSSNTGRYIQGILAYDLKNSGASCNVSVGGLGSNFVNLRLKSGRGKSMDYDIYVYA